MTATNPRRYLHPFVCRRSDALCNGMNFMPDVSEILSAGRTDVASGGGGRGNHAASEVASHCLPKPVPSTAGPEEHGGTERSQITLNIVDWKFLPAPLTMVMCSRRRQFIKTNWASRKGFTMLVKFEEEKQPQTVSAKYAAGIRSANMKFEEKQK